MRPGMLWACLFGVGVAACGGAPPPAPQTPVAPVAAPPPKPAVVAPAPGADLSYWKDRKDLIKAPPPPVPAELKLPPVERWKLKNGLDVIVVPRAELPIVSFALAVKAGGYDEDRSRLAVSGFTADMLRKGTKKRKADEISKAIEFVGGTLSTSSGMESSDATCTALSKDNALCLDLLSDIVINPTFPEGEMAEVRDQMVGALNQRFDNPGALASEHFANLLFGERHPDGWVTTPDDVKKITRDQLQEFWRTHYRPGNAILAVAGDVDVARLKVDLEKALGAGVWAAGEVPAREEPKVPEPKGTRILLIDREDLTQTTATFGHRGIKHADPDWYAVTMVNYVLGGSDFSSRLTQEVRAKQGLTYGISSSFGSTLFEGSFRVSTSTKNETAWRALESTVREISRMKTEGPTEEELAKAKGYYAGSYPFRLQSAAGIASSIVGAELHGLGIDYVKQFPVRIAAVDVAQAKAAASKWLQPDKLVVVVVGKGAEVAPQIAAANFKFEKIHFKDPISSYERARQRQAEKKAAAPAEMAKAMAMVQAAIAAHGGEAALRSVKDMKVTLAGTLKRGESMADTETTRFYIRPDKVRIDQAFMAPEGTLNTELVSTAAGIKVRMGRREVPAKDPRLREQARAIFSDPTFVLLNLVDAQPPIALVPIVSVNEGGRTLEGLSFKPPGSGGGGDQVTLYFDAKTKLIARVKMPTRGGDLVIDLLDYKPVAGIQFPYRRTSNANSGSGEEKVTDVKVNAGVDAGLFK